MSENVSCNHGGQRLFSEKKHQSRQWNTTAVVSGNGLFRAWCNWISFKRHGVDSVARRVKKNPLLLDLGCGNGAYTFWFLGRHPDASVVMVDWAVHALRKNTLPCQYRTYRVCADIHALPFKTGCFDAVFSIDTLGHVQNQEMVLDEVARAARQKALLFLHCECSDYKNRWPDTVLIKRNKADVLAFLDGHYSLFPSDTIREKLQKRFRIRNFYSPAGLLGWLTGYPEKYCIAFRQASLPVLSIVTAVSAAIKKIPVAGSLLRMINALSNHLELCIGLQGGGSCFADAENEKPGVIRGNERADLADNTDI